MQTPKLSLVICALALTSTLAVRAADNAAQAAARVALAAKLFEVSAQTPTNPPAVVITPTAKAVVAPVVIAAPAMAAEPVLTPISADAKAKAKAQAKADKLAAEAQAKADAAQAAADKKAQQEADKLAAAAAKANAKIAAPPSINISPAAPKVMVAANGDNPAQAAARIALAQKLFETSQPKSGWEAPSQTTAAKPAKPVAKATPAPKPQPAPSAQPVRASLVKVDAPKASYVSDAPVMKPIFAPSSPLPATKQEQLQALLLKYKADQVTPEEYFNQRAAILREP